MSYTDVLHVCERSMKQLGEYVREGDFTGRSQDVEAALNVLHGHMGAVARAVKIVQQRSNIERAEAVIVQARERIAELGGVP